MNILHCAHYNNKFRVEYFQVYRYRYPSTMEIVVSKSDSNHVQFINSSFTDKEELKGIHKLILNALF